VNEEEFEEVDSLEPIDLSRLRVMAKKFPEDYANRLELMLFKRDQNY